MTVTNATRRTHRTILPATTHLHFRKKKKAADAAFFNKRSELAASARQVLGSDIGSSLAIPRDRTALILRGINQLLAGNLLACCPTHGGSDYASGNFYLGDILALNGASGSQTGSGI